MNYLAVGAWVTVAIVPAALLNQLYPYSVLAFVVAVTWLVSTSYVMGRIEARLDPMKAP